MLKKSFPAKCPPKNSKLSDIPIIMGTFGPHHFTKTCPHTHAQTCLQGELTAGRTVCVCVCTRASICVSVCVCPQVQPNPRHMTPPLVKFTMCAIMWLWHGYCYDLNWRGTAESDRWNRTPGLCPGLTQLFFYGQVLRYNCMDLIRDLHVSRNSCCFYFIPSTCYTIRALHLRGCHYRCSRDSIGWKKTSSSRCFLFLIPL